MSKDRAPVVIFEARNVYGTMLYYPANAQAQILAQIAKRRTFNEPELILAARMGLTVNITGDQRAQITAARIAEAMEAMP